MKNFNFSVPPKAISCLGALALLLAAHAGIQAATTDIATTPLTANLGVKPNVMLLIDTSNSMTWTHMPDSVEVANAAQQHIGYKNHLCNSIYYNRAVVYKTPKDSAGNPLPTPSFTAAPYNYFLAPATTVNLSTAFQAHDANTVSNTSTALPDTPQAAYYYRFTPPSPTVTKPSAAACTQAEPGSGATTPFAAAGGGTWQKIIVSATSGQAPTVDERTNFAIWYTYYRTRLAMAKSSVGTALSSPVINDTRVGLITVNPMTPTPTPSSPPAAATVDTAKYLPINDFTPTQRANFYTKLNGLTAGGTSPAREGLARVGRHYAGKTDGINNGMPDPVIYSCQSNYTILTTDGYWNTFNEWRGPVGIDGTTRVGQRDGNTEFPQTSDSGLVPLGVFDGTPALTTTTTNVVSNTTEYRGGLCQYNSLGKAIKKTTRKVERLVKTTTFPSPPNNAFIRRPITYTKKTFTTTSTSTTQNVTTHSLSSSWGEYLFNEITTVVPSCSPSPGPGLCTPRSYGPVSVPSCPATLPAGQFGTPVCTSSTESNIPVASCTPSANVTCGPIQSTVWNGLLSCPSNSTCTSTPPVTTTGLSSCTAGFNSSTGVTTQCTPVYGTGSTVSSCTASATVDCSAPFCSTLFGTCTTPPPVVEPGVACTPSAGPPTVSCSWQLVSGPTAVNPTTCTANTPASASNGWQRTTCATTTSPYSSVATCTPTPATSPAWEEILCSNTGGLTYGLKLETRVTTTTTTTITPPFGSPTTTTSGPTNPAWVNVNEPPVCVPTASLVVPSNTTVTSPPTTTSSTTGAVSSLNSLADVAQYYYANDLRGTGSLNPLAPHGNPNNVKEKGSGWNDDRATWQHMTTFVIGLGVSGTKAYDPNYKTATTGDFGALRASPPTGFWPEWPLPALDPATPIANQNLLSDARSIDDFWHAAVNGRGQYFNASDSDTLSTGLVDTFKTILGGIGAGSGSVLSDTINLTSDGQNFATKYNSSEFSGELLAFDTAGVLQWNAQLQLDAQVAPSCDSRNIYIRNAASSTGLVDFTWNTVKCPSATPVTSLSTTQQALFSPSLLNHYAAMTPAQQSAATGATLVNYLRGQTQYSGFGFGDPAKLYRKRAHVLGDIVNSRPVYVREPVLGYGDSGYAAFKAAGAGRKPMIYVGTRAGMLHAFYAPKTLPDASAGKEAWAYIPTAILPNLHKLANPDYSSTRALFVDGSPVVGDVKSGSTWRTILVGSLGSGGPGYFALDVTDPEAPKSLWEFDTTSAGGADLGVSMGRPVIIKLKSGQWVVMLTSGYNNATGLGRLYILDAVTGALIRTMSTTAGTASDPSGLSEVGALVMDRETDMTAERVYGGDLLGNMWRFDVNDVLPPSGYDVTLLGTAKDPLGNVQPITTLPELRTTTSRSFVYFGTGRLLGVSDMTTTQVQSIYGVVDPLNTSNPVHTDLRSGSKLLKTDVVPIFSTSPPFTKTDETINIVCASGSCSGTYPTGWVIDLTVPRERVNIRPALLRNTLVIATNTPLTAGVSCESNFESRLYFINPSQGVQTGPGKFFNQAIVGSTFIFPDPSTYGTQGANDGRTKVTITKADGSRETVGSYSTPTPAVNQKRASTRSVVRLPN